jgi:hypothetical protein
MFSTRYLAIYSCDLIIKRHGYKLIVIITPIIIIPIIIIPIIITRAMLRTNAS